VAHARVVQRRDEHGRLVLAAGRHGVHRGSVANDGPQP
jgi:hypothetical protein